VIKQNDIVCFSETKTDDLDKFELEDIYTRGRTRHTIFYITTITIYTTIISIYSRINKTIVHTVKNCYGNKLLELCRGNSLFLLNGRVGEDQHEGRLTCKNSSTVDYCLCTVYLIRGVLV
jgi:hypothetical protein